MSNSSIWGDIPLKPGEIKTIRMADLSAFIHLLNNEIKIAFIYSNNDMTDTANLDHLDWQRWPQDKKILKIKVHPVLPDRPVLIKPESLLYLPEYSETRIFCRLPLFIRISLVFNTKTDDLIDIPTIKLSKTWFGTFKEGEICYSITSGTRTEIETDPQRPFLAICPLKLRNKTKEQFPTDKICLRTDYLSLFIHNEQIWTDETSISYTGKNEISQVNFSGRQPNGLDGAKILTRPKEVLKKSLYTSSFSTIKDLHGSGLFAGK